jgi:hypothetical protein
MKKTIQDFGSQVKKGFQENEFQGLFLASDGQLVSAGLEGDLGTIIAMIVNGMKKNENLQAVVEVAYRAFKEDSKNSDEPLRLVNKDLLDILLKNEGLEPSKEEEEEDELRGFGFDFDTSIAYIELSTNGKTMRSRIKGDNIYLKNLLGNAVLRENNFGEVLHSVSDYIKSINN